MEGYNISFDASTTCTGYSIFDGDILVKYGKIKPLKTLEWRDRIQCMSNEIKLILDQYNVKKAYVEDIPLKKGGMKVLVQLGCVQGMLLGLLCGYNIPIEFIPVATWRRKIGLFDGTVEGKERDNLKIHSIKKANKLFDLDLQCVLTKGGNYNPEKSDDDISDSILIYASTREKYAVKDKKGFGKKIKI